MKSLLSFALVAVVGLVYGWPPVRASPSRRLTDPSTKIAPPRPSETGDADEVTSCEYEGAVYPVGVFRPDTCKRCECLRGGLVGCASASCPPSPCVDPVQVPGVCCLQCPNGANCMGPNGIAVPVGGKFELPEHNVMCECLLMGYYTGAACKIQD